MEIRDIIIEEHLTLIETMAALDKTAKKVLFVERENQLVASITDGDIRRWILTKGSLDARVKDIANYNPKFLFEKDRAKAKQVMKKESIESLPIVNNNKKIISVVLLHDGDIGLSKRLDVPVVIMAGGYGTRLYPYTKILPKPLIPVGDIPIAEHIINRFRKFACSQFYLVVNHKKNMVKAYFNEMEKDYQITYIDEDRPLGTGGGLSLLKGQIDSTFILSNCDIIVDEDYEKMYKYHKEASHLITMVCTLKNFTIPYGIVEIGENGNIESMTEKPNMSFFTNTGLYFVEPRVIEDLQENQTLGFPDIIERYTQAGENVGVYPISENAWMDMGQLDAMEEMRKRLENDLPE